MKRDQGLTEFFLNNTLNQQVVLKEGFLLSLTIAYTGVTAGQVVYFRDGNGPEDQILVPITLPAANGTLQLKWEMGKYFSTGLYYNPAVTARTVLIEGTYR